MRSVQPYATVVATTDAMAASKTRAPAKKNAKQSAAKQATATKTPAPSGVPAKKPRVFAIPFASVYPLYLQKAENKGRTRQEVDEVIAWLTGYEGQALRRVIDTKVDLETFFARAPRMTPNTKLIKRIIMMNSSERIRSS